MEEIETMEVAISILRADIAARDKRIAVLGDLLGKRDKRIALLEAELAAAKDAWIDKELYAKKENSK